MVLTSTTSAPVPSVAILIYLSLKYQTADHWYPSDLQARVRVHEYLGWHADCIRSVFGVSLWAQVRKAIWGVVNYQRPGRRQGPQTKPTLCSYQVLAPLIGIQVPQEKMERNRTAVDKALQYLEDKFLGDRAFLTSQHVTLADLMALEELIQV